MATDLAERTTTYQRLLVVSIVAAAAGFLVRLPSGLDTLMAVVGSLGTVGFALAWFLARPRRDEPPDVLAELTGTYYERDGLCFAPKLVVASNLCWFTVYCQNCYSEPIVATVSFVPMEGMSTAGAHDVPPVTVHVDVEGGDVCAVHVPYPIAKAWQGKVMVYDVGAKTTYPQGRGRVVRSGKGTAVGEPAEQLSAAEQVVQAVGDHVLPFRGLRLRPGAFEVRLPEGVADQASPDVAARRELLYRWRRGLATNDGVERTEDE